MSSKPTPIAATTVSRIGGLPWVRRLRVAAAVIIFWAALHYLLGTTLMVRGLDRPVALSAAHVPILAGLALAVVVCAGAFVAPRLTGGRTRDEGLLIITLSLALWAYGGGTMTDWLILCQREVGPPSGAAYWPLVLEYVVLAVIATLAAAVSAASALSTGQSAQTSVSSRLRSAFAAGNSRSERTRGILALLTCTAIIGVLMLLLTGPAVGRTLAGQCYFAIGVSTAAGVFAAARLYRVREPIWYWPAPILAGLIGMVVSGLKPDLMIPVDYRMLNSIPAWGLARAMPLQMVGFGVAVALWTLRATFGTARTARA